MQTQQTHTQGDKTPLISFIIAAYNLPVEMLQECISHILKLSLSKEEREIIVIDDGSDVSPLNDLLDVRDRIIYLRQRNQGLSVARNTGIRLATGKYIQFVDGDDCLLNVPYEHCLDIARYHTPDVVLFEATDTNQVEVPFTFEGPISGSSYMHNNNLRAAAWGYIFRRSILINLRFTPGILHEDEEFTPQLMLRAERVFVTNAKAYFYRQRKGSIINSSDKNHKLRRLADTERVIFHLQDVAETLPEIDRVALKRRVAQLSMDYLYNTIQLTRSNEHLEQAVEHLRKRGLFPLPDKDYTRKYKLFRKAANTKIGRRLLIIALPRL